MHMQDSQRADLTERPGPERLSEEEFLELCVTHSLRAHLFGDTPWPSPPDDEDDLPRPRCYILAAVNPDVADRFIGCAKHAYQPAPTSHPERECIEIVWREA